ASLTGMLTHATPNLEQNLFNEENVVQNDTRPQKTHKYQPFYLPASPAKLASSLDSSRSVKDPIPLSSLFTPRTPVYSMHTSRTSNLYSLFTTSPQQPIVISRPSSSNSLLFSSVAPTALENIRSKSSSVLFNQHHTYHQKAENSRNSFSSETTLHSSSDSLYDGLKNYHITESSYSKDVMRKPTLTIQRKILEPKKNPEFIFFSLSFYVTTFGMLCFLYLLPGLQALVKRNLGNLPTFLCFMFFSSALSSLTYTIKLRISDLFYDVLKTDHVPKFNLLLSNVRLNLEIMGVALVVVTIISRCAWLFFGLLYVYVVKVPSVGVVFVAVAMGFIGVLVAVSAVCVLAWFCWDVTNEMHKAMVHGVEIEVGAESSAAQIEEEAFQKLLSKHWN
ncbi:hypothetical protein HK096_003754, partial [Nowakowskiella sp. JEL0078]